MGHYACDMRPEWFEEEALTKSTLGVYVVPLQLMCGCGYAMKQDRKIFVDPTPKTTVYCNNKKCSDYLATKTVVLKRADIEHS